MPRNPFGGPCGCRRCLAACCGDGTRLVATDLVGPQSPGCGSLAGNDGYDLAGGVTGTSTLGVGVAITGTTDTWQLGLGCPSKAASSDVGAACEYVLGVAGTGPVRITFAPPVGKRVCAVYFSVSGEDFGTNNTWTATIADTGGTLTETDLTVETLAFNPCVLAGDAIAAFAAAGESIMYVEVSHGTPADNYLAIGYVGICLTSGAADLGLVDSDDEDLVDSDGYRLIWSY